MKPVILIILALLMLNISNAQDVTSSSQATTSLDQDSINQIIEKRLKTFLKVKEGTSGWFNSFVTTLYNKGQTVARRGQVDNYLWSNEKLVAFHFFTYGGGSNTHYITSLDSNGNVTTIEHVLTQNLKLDNYFNVDRYGDDQILCTDETVEMHMNNGGKAAKNKTYLSAIIYGITKDGKLTKTPFK